MIIRCAGLFAVFSLAMFRSGWAQPPAAEPPNAAQAADDSKPASTNAPGQQYPRVDSASRVTFRVRAQARKKCRFSSATRLIRRRRST